MSKKGENLALRLLKSEGAPKRFTWGCVYQANVVPKRGADNFLDVAKAETLEKACWRFMVEHQDVGLLHQDGTSGSGQVVECAIHRGPAYKTTAADGTSVEVNPGDWLLGVVWSPKAWQLITSGRVTGYSFQGSARRRPVRKGKVRSV